VILSYAGGLVNKLILLVLLNNVLCNIQSIKKTEVDAQAINEDGRGIEILIEAMRSVNDLMHSVVGNTDKSKDGWRTYTRFPFICGFAKI